MKLRELLDEGFPISERPGPFPFSHSTTVGLEDRFTRRRLAAYFAFIKEFHAPGLDIGQPNSVSEAVCRHLRTAGNPEAATENTLESDFNETVRAPHSAYGTVFCFEVLEHIMNPLRFMKNIHGLLAPGGIVYLSTPRMSLISIYASNYHFTEYKAGKLRRLFEWAGFTVEEITYFNVFPWWTALKGVRPLWRFLFQRYMIFKLRKNRS